MLFIIEGFVVSTPQNYEARQTHVELNTVEAENEQTIYYKDESSFGEESFTKEYVSPYSLVCKKTSIIFSLTKKDFAEVFYYKRQQ